MRSLTLAAATSALTMTSLARGQASVNENLETALMYVNMISQRGRWLAKGAIAEQVAFISRLFGVPTKA